MLKMKCIEQGLPETHVSMHSFGTRKLSVTQSNVPGINHEYYLFIIIIFELI